MSAPIRYEVEGGIARVVLDHGRGNAIDDALVTALADAVRRVDEDDSIRAVMLAAEGKLFCPGLDLPALLQKERGELEAFMRRFGAVIRSMFSLGKPLVAALHGHAVAGGCVLALTADWRILAPKAQFGLNEVKVGVPIPFGPTSIVREVVPPQHHTAVALLGRNFRGGEALEAGLVQEVAPAEPEAFAAHCAERLAEFAEKDTAAFRATKNYLRSAAAARMRQHDPQLIGEFLDAWYSESTQARIRSVVERLKGA